MRALLIYACSVIGSNVVGVFASSFVGRYTSPSIVTIVILGCFFGSLVVSWMLGGLRRNDGNNFAIVVFAVSLGLDVDP